VWSLARVDLLSLNDAQRLLTTQPKQLKSEALAGGGLSDANADVWVLDPSDRDHILEPGETDRFVFDLPNHVGAGRLWTLNELRSEGFTLEPVVYAPPKRKASTPVIVGGDGRMLRYLLVPQHSSGEPQRRESARRQVLALQEGAPWEDSGAAADRFEVAYEPERIAGGFSEHERARRFATVRGNG
jgi:hypothetical protein